MKMATLACHMASVLSVCVSTSAVCGEILSDSVKSAVLGRNLNFTVYVPDGYKDAPGTFPVVFLLHGAGGDEHSWVRGGGAKETLDGLIRRGLIRPIVAVMPTTGPESWWVDGASERAETAMMTELLPYVEGKYKVTAERTGRAIGGLSMGAYGALNLALRYPTKFCAASIISPAIYDPLPHESSSARKAAQFMRGGQFDPETWKALNYPAHLDRYTQGGERVPMWIVSGDHDFLGIALMSAQLYWRVLKIQPKLAELRIIDGDHESMTFRDALPDSLQYVNRHCPGK